jgi:hypothetical protein
VVRLDVIGDSSDGRLWILDVAAAPDTLAAPPERRLPLVSLGSVTVTEGDAPGTSVARLPYTVSGDVTRPAQLTVGIVEQSRRRGRDRLRLDLAPGQTEGTLRYEYSANTVDDAASRRVGYGAFVVRGAMTDKYDGQVVVRDDDPAPDLRVRAPKRVDEGRSITVLASLSEATGYDSYVGIQVVRGSGTGPRLSAGDVPKRWLRSHYAEGEDPRRPLHRADVFLHERLRPGDRSAVFEIPVRDDRVRERPERVTLKIQVNRKSVTRTVGVVD